MSEERGGPDWDDIGFWAFMIVVVVLTVAGGDQSFCTLSIDSAPSSTEAPVDG